MHYSSVVVLKTGLSHKSGLETAFLLFRTWIMLYSVFTRSRSKYTDYLILLSSPRPAFIAIFSIMTIVHKVQYSNVFKVDAEDFGQDR